MTDDLVGTAEITKLLGVSKQRVDQLARTEGFPKPQAVLAAGRIWRRKDIESWARKAGRLK
jgi:predicted DNA-binding transcriptional regulator AlpA